MEEQLKTALSQAITAFNTNRTAILKKAFDEGGSEAVDKLNEEYDALRDAYFEILRRQLDKNNHRYEQLISEADTEARKLENSINQLSNINGIIDAATATINVVGRALMVLGI